jgi:hypothetical protein
LEPLPFLLFWSLLDTQKKKQKGRAAALLRKSAAATKTKLP